MDIDQLAIQQEFSPGSIRLPRDLVRFNNWVFTIIQPYIKGRVLEMGSGSGDISAMLAHQNIPIHLSDSDKRQRDNLREKFTGTETIRGVHNIDFQRPDFHKRYASRQGIFSTIMALNLMEHGFYDKTTLDNASYLLRKRGHLIAIMPAQTIFYDQLDQNLHDLKKYDRRFVKAFWGDGFEILLTRYCNLQSGNDGSSTPNFGLSALTALRKKT